MADVGCAGMLVADTFCGPMRELPREGNLLAIDDMPVRAGGCAANVAITLSKQNLAVDISGCLGRDASASVLISCFEQHRIGHKQLVYTDQFPTSKTVILLVEGQDRRYIHTFGSNRAYSVGPIDRNWVASLKVFYVGGLLAMPGIQTDELADLLKFCRAKKIVTVVDVVVPQGFRGMEQLKPVLAVHRLVCAQRRRSARLYRRRGCTRANSRVTGSRGEDRGHHARRARRHRRVRQGHLAIRHLPSESHRSLRLG